MNFPCDFSLKDTSLEAKDDKNLPVFNYSIDYDTYNREFFYEQYPGVLYGIVGNGEDINKNLL